MSVLDKAKGWAAELEGAEAHVACAGTKIEQTSYKVKKKSFFFAQQKEELAIFRLKLDKSLDEAAKLAGSDERVEVGVKGWVTLRVPLKGPAPRPLRKWIRESHAMSS